MMTFLLPQFLSIQYNAFSKFFPQFIYIVLCLVKIKVTVRTIIDVFFFYLAKCRHNDVGELAFFVDLEVVIRTITQIKHIHQTLLQVCPEDERISVGMTLKRCYGE